MSKLNEQDLNKLAEEFKLKIFKDLHMENLKPEEKEKFLEKLNKHVNTIVITTVMNNLKEDQLSEIDGRLKASVNDQEKDQIIAQFAASIQDLDKKIIEELDLLYNSLIKTSEGLAQNN